MRLLAEAACEQVIDVLGDVAPPAVADPDERGKLAYLLAWSRVCADERAEQLQGALGLLLAEPADEQLQPLPRCHASRLTANAITCRALQSSGCAGGGGKERRLAAAKSGDDGPLADPARSVDAGEPVNDALGSGPHRAGQRQGAARCGHGPPPGRRDGRRGMTGAMCWAVTATSPGEGRQGRPRRGRR